MQKFIDLGIHTVPLQGSLERIDDGISKTIPHFPKDWRETYTEKFNKRPTDIGGAITGKVSNLIAIDCDNATTWQLFTALDPYNKFVFLSKGKEGGTLLYQYDEEVPSSFSINDDNLRLDFYSNQGFVYLATEGNKTKVPLPDPLPELPPLPEIVKTTLIRMYKSTRTITTNETKENNDTLFTTNFLAPLVTQFTQNRGEYMPGLFRIITPKKYRTLDYYLKHTHLHPNEIPEGEGSSYLSQVSAVLGADPSISQELYAEAMTYINDLFDEPMSTKRFDATIVNPMLNGKASVDGVPIWGYNPDWEQYRALYLTKDQSTVEAVYDDAKKVFYVIDESRGTFQTMVNESELYGHLQALTGTLKTRRDIVREVPLVRSVVQPHKPFGLRAGADPTKREFNTYRATPALAIFYEPESYAEKYKEPKITLKFFETLVPDKTMRQFLLSFLKTKLTSFKYSPVVLYFLGVPGSGKGTFVNLIEEIFGLVPAPTSSEFLDKFNGWLLDAYFVELDEYGDTLSTFREKEEAIGKLKALTGKQKVDIRLMRTNSYSYEHNATFIMTANKNPLMLDEQDRRIALFNTPNVLADQYWVSEEGGIDKVYNTIMESVNDFCYYLATEVPTLNSSEYMKPPTSENKFFLIADNLPAAARIAYCFRHKQIDYLKELCYDYACVHVAEEIDTGEVSVTTLEDIYQELTNEKGTRRALIKALRDSEDVTLKRSGTNSSDFSVVGYLNKFPSYED